MRIFQLIFILFIFLSCHLLQAQGWLSIYQPALGVDFYRDSDGGFIVFSKVNKLLKFDIHGDFISEYVIEDFNTNSILYTFEKEFLLLQTDLSESPTKASVTLLDADKQTQWVYQLEDFPFHENSQHSSSGARDAIQNEQGDYFVFGTSYEYATLSPVEGYDYYVPFLIKLNAQGERQWFQTYSNTLPPLDNGRQDSYAIKKSGDGGFILMTIVLSRHFQENYPGFIKVNAEGDIVWEQYFYLPLIVPEHDGVEYIIEYPVDNMVVTESGEIVTAGMSRPKDEYIGIPYLMTLNSDSSLKSFFPLDIPFNQEYLYNIEIEDIQQYGENFILLYDGLVGEKYSMGFVIVDKTGNILLNKFYENTLINSGFVAQIMVLEEGGFAILGGTFFEDNVHVVLVKTDSLGNCYPDTQFTAEDTGLGLYQFDNQSEYADSYLWEFGDGTTDTTSIASHQYQAIGTYEVCLTATNLCDSFKKCENIEVSEITDIEVHEWEQGLLVYPNPVHNTRLFVEIPQTTELPILTLYNSFGQQIQASVNSNILNTNELEVGVYYLAIEVRGEKAVRKIIVY